MNSQPDKNIKSEQAVRLIKITDSFIPVAKSILTLPIFNSANNASDEPLAISYEDERFKYFGYENLTITTKQLSVGFDFNVFMHILAKYIETGSQTIFFDFEEFFNLKHMNISRNNFPTYRAMTAVSLSKIEEVKCTFNKIGYEHQPNKLGFIGDLKAVPGKGYFIDIRAALPLFYDADLISNLDMEVLNSIKSLSGKALYLLYISNNMNLKNSFTIETLKFRLQSKEKKAAEFNRTLSGAHKELLKLKIISQYEVIKDTKDNRTAQKYEVTLTNVLTSKAKKEAKKLEDKKPKPPKPPKSPEPPKRPSLFN